MYRKQGRTLDRDVVPVEGSHHHGVAVTCLAVFLIFDDMVLVVCLFDMVSTVGLALSIQGT